MYFETSKKMKWKENNCQNRQNLLKFEISNSLTACNSGKYDML
jgi:hypothetical protein